MPSTTHLCFVSFIVLVCCFLSVDSYQSSDQQTASETVANPFKNGARPSFRQYSSNYGSDYAGQNQQYGYSNGGQYDNGQWNQRYPPQYGEPGFQRDPRYNGASTVGTSLPTFVLLGLGLVGVFARGLLS